MDVYIRVVETYRRTFAVFAGEVIGDSVFSAVGYKFGMSKYFGIDDSIDSKGLINRHPSVPVQILYRFIYFVGI